MLLTGVVARVFGVRGRLGDLALLEVLDKGLKVGAREGATTGADDLIPPVDVRGEGASIRVGAVFLQVLRGA